MQALRILRICSDPVTAQLRCDELIEYLVHRGHGRRRTQLEVQRAMDANRNPQQHIRNIDRGEYFTAQYHPGLPDIKGTLRTFLPILYTSDRLCMAFSRPPVVSFSQPKYLSQKLCRVKLQEPLKKPTRINNANAIAASYIPPLLLLAASPAPATVEHSIVATRVRIAI